ncbi:FRG domain-containing protein [Microbacterium sp. STF-2]|uniref:FRG domain-containing protein n=1 Tax=Microbacterium sp. STF-2 TaxID=3031132 RepID=UPI002AFE41E5|nr:FRG domain-containing protein [Microbacterium sp. STF-2]MEA1264172.1 FRG domain-containing protein [Microbacterium sp. STF-2]
MKYRTLTAASEDFASAAPNAVRDAAREVLTAIDGINLLGPKDGVVWRGQAVEDWRLGSKAGRAGLNATEIRSLEVEMIEQARRIGADNAQHMGDWEILARLRHHGALTRLIDCSTDPFVALWFLCDDRAKVDEESTARDHDGLLLALTRTQFTQIDRPYERNYRRAFDRAPAALLYSTPPIDPRIAAQRGVFVLHTEPHDAVGAPESELGPLAMPTKIWAKEHRRMLHDLCGASDLAGRRGRLTFRFPTTMGIVVPAIVKPLLLEMLERNFGFNRSTMFPDFSGMGEYYGARRA